MKTITFKNKFNGERVVCKDVKEIQVIDGIEYLFVSKTIQDRKFLMRKDALEKVKDTPVVKQEITRPCEGLVPGSTPGGGANQWCCQCSGNTTVCETVDQGSIPDFTPNAVPQFNGRTLI